MTAPDTKEDIYSGVGLIRNQLSRVRDAVDEFHHMLVQSDGIPMPEAIARVYSDAGFAIQTIKEELDCIREDEEEKAAQAKEPRQPAATQ